MKDMETKSLFPEKKIWAVGGGKGGTGKTMVTSSLGVQLSKMGKKVLIIDADLGGANLHTSLGIKYPKTTLSDFLSKKVKCLNDVLLDTPFDNLKIISGARDLMNTANPIHSQKMKLIKHIKGLSMDYTIVDIGSGTSYNVLDFFIISNSGIVVVVPEPTSIENLYRFLKGSVLRIIKFSIGNTETKKFFELYSEAEKNFLDYNINNLLDQFRDLDEALSEKIKLRIDSFRPKLIINQVRERKDIDLGRSISKIAEKYLGIKVTYLGYIPYDESVPRALKKFKPFIVENPNSSASLNLLRIGERLLNGVMT